MMGRQLSVAFACIDILRVGCSVVRQPGHILHKALHDSNIRWKVDVFWNQTASGNYGNTLSQWCATLLSACHTTAAHSNPTIGTM